MIRKLFVVFVGVFLIVSTHLVSAEEPELESEDEGILLTEPREITSLVDKLIHFTCIGKVPGIYPIPHTYCVVFAVCYVEKKKTIHRLYACPAGTVYSAADVNCVPVQTPNVCKV